MSVLTDHAHIHARQEPSTAVPVAPVAERWYSEKRLGALSRFACAITLLNLAGHLFLGFEQPWIAPFVALAAAYATEFVGESLEALGQGRRPRFFGSGVDLIKFLLPAHITGLATGMLLYACDFLWPVAFAASLAVASKYVFRVALRAGPDGRRQVRHFLNPSNVGITVTLLLFPTVGIAPPYQFTENTSGLVDWILPLIIIGSGTYLNVRATGRIPLILAWVAAFAFQALMRSAIHGTPWNAGMMPITGFAFILFTFYMITDPATTPTKTVRQILFGCAVAFAYAVLMERHVVFGLFYALTLVTAVRGAFIYLHGRYLEGEFPQGLAFRFSSQILAQQSSAAKRSIASLAAHWLSFDSEREASGRKYTELVATAPERASDAGLPLTSARQLSDPRP